MNFTLPPGVEVPELDEYEDAETQIFWRDEISRNIATKFVSKKPADNMRDALCRVVREQDRIIKGMAPMAMCPSTVSPRCPGGNDFTPDDCYRCWRDETMRRVREEGEDG